VEASRGLVSSDGGESRGEVEGEDRTWRRKGCSIVGVGVVSRTGVEGERVGWLGTGTEEN